MTNMMVNPTFAPNDKYFGRREICLFCESTVQLLFPVASTSSNPSTTTVSTKDSKHSRSLSSTFRKSKKAKSQVNLGSPNSDNEMEREVSLDAEDDLTAATRSKTINIAEWLAYVFYRTALPLPIIFHALHLLRRLSSRYSFDPTSPSSRSPLVHHRLIFTSLILATTYSMDDSYSLKSWTTASKGLFNLAELTEMQLEMMESLNWTLGGEEEESFFGDRIRKGLVDILEGYLEDWEIRLQTERVTIEQPTVLESHNVGSGVCGMGNLKKRKLGGEKKVGGYFKEGLRRMRSGDLTVHSSR